MLVNSVNRLGFGAITGAYIIKGGNWQDRQHVALTEFEDKLEGGNFVLNVTNNETSSSESKTGVLVYTDKKDLKRVKDAQKLYAVDKIAQIVQKAGNEQVRLDEINQKPYGIIDLELENMDSVDENPDIKETLF